MKNLVLVSLLLIGAPCAEAALEKSAASEKSNSITSKSLTQELLNLRDPFQIPPTLSGGLAREISKLERHPIQDFKLIGISTGPKNLRGMLKGPDGDVHFVSVGDRIGTRQGVVMAIGPKEVSVQEKIVNVLGQEELVDSKIELPDENR